MMKVLVDLVDTGQVQFFHPIIKRLIADGHTLKVTARDKDLTLDLLDKYGINYTCLSRMGKGLWGLCRELVGRDIKLLRIARRFRPDVMLAQTGVSVCLTGTLLRIPTIVLEEAEHAKLQRMISLPFATRIMTGTGYLCDHGSKQRRFRGIWVQSYLSPEFFHPSREPLEKAGVDPDEPYIILRTVAWEAAHDVGHKSMDEASLREAISRLEPYGRVLISSEKPLPESLKSYGNPVPTEQVHHLLAFARLYIGEGGTMAAEAAVLGTPAIFCSPLRCGYLVALEKDYDLLSQAQTFQEGLAIAETLLQREDLTRQWDQKCRRLWDQTDDIVQFTCELLTETVKGS
jgi:hypothetical protein